MDGQEITTRDDADLIAALDAGGVASRVAWSELVRRHSPRLYAVARSFGLDPVTAEDLVQIAWLRLIERSAQLRSPEALGAWLCTIVRNEARRLVVRRREIPAAIPVEGVGDVEPPADTRLIRDERAHALRLAFAHLGVECQQLLRLLLVEPPLSYDEIAAAVDRPRGSLGPTRRRCLDRLRELLPSGFEP
jgi:RNA polymerase sigma factor (sigma-70 family)